MQDKIKEFLESGQLESYVIGVLSPAEAAVVERWIADHPQVRAAYEELQDQIEQMAMQQSVVPPAAMKEKILSQIPSSTDNITSQPMWLKAVATILLVGSGLLWYSGSQSKAALEALHVAYTALEKDCSKTKDQLIAQQETNVFIQDKDTEMVRLSSGKDDYEAIAFVNESKRKLLWKNLVKQELPKTKCFQLWGDHEGKMIALGVIKDIDSSYYIDLAMDFESLNITLENVTPDGKGQLSPDVSQLVASVAI